MTTRLGERYGRGCSRTARRMLNTAPFAPMPRASTATTPAVKNGARRHARTASRTSRSGSHMMDSLSVSLFPKPEQHDAVADAGWIGRLRCLKCHEAAVGRDDRVRRLAGVVVAEVRQPHEVLAGTVELQLPDIDVVGAMASAKRLDLTVALDARVLPVGKDAFDLVVRARRFREVRDRAGREDNPHHGRGVVRLVARKRHLRIAI